MKTKKTTQFTNNAGIEPADRAERMTSETEQRPNDRTHVTDMALAKTEGGREPVKTWELEMRVKMTKEQFLKATGARSLKVAKSLIVQATRFKHGRERASEDAQLALDLLGEMAPRNATEGMLAVQMIGVHHAAGEFIRRTLNENQNLENLKINVASAAVMVRLFNEQAAAMAKLKGTASQQKMTVEHVHIHAGGQAIVGPVARGNEAGGDEGDTK